MEILENISLKTYNTFGIAVKARYFCEVTTIAELKNVLQRTDFPEILILGGGSNMLLTQDLEALVIYVNLKGIRVLHEDDDTVIVEVMAGENWHQMVVWTLDQGYGGLENLSLIPGNTGTAPIQNIGAYGVELKDVFERCEAMEQNTQVIHQFSKEACKFDYRDSYFKNEGKGKYVIVSVRLKLTKKNHAINTTYGAIESHLAQQNIRRATPKAISNAVIAIRQSKLPDPSEIGNSGSFFKNPVINATSFHHLKATYPDIPYYKISDSTYKIPAGWLIERCGYKGKRFGDAGVHAHQALVLVNYGNASGQDILHLAQRIISDVQSRFQITIEPEVNIIK
ncbi:UDP-N-acetylmuramate dehydrogenase [Arenibacter sp. GZD96]|uniref:UDP-N-acetylmuramate dehydrogenase n=1 Tax=Aurantibrevibacter litoralis TaxID=3106030 RepID=UPI002AFF91DF|nr:UDP-N-acetylmuramate dehydrogenase [Arenibacter sp. GZD-96]MEA1786866.1 UDP-N-acetylmuramate dehydrogenase [Arenibacter sp. GZD-96]